MSVGRVPKPPKYRDHIWVMEQEKFKPGWDGVAGWESYSRNRRIVGVCVHRMVGWLESTETYFAFPGDGFYSLTDFGIGGYGDNSDFSPRADNKPYDYDGEVWQWNNLIGNRRPWANGWDESESPAVVTEGHGRSFYYDYMQTGILDENVDLASIELSGLTDTPMTVAQFEALAHTIAYVCDNFARIPWESFPYNPNVAEDFYAVYEHYEFAGKDCPFPIVKALNGQYIARAKEIMKYYQQGGTGSTPPAGVGLPASGTTGNGNGGMPARFAAHDRIKNAQSGPINLRSGPTTSISIVKELQANEELCVNSGPTVAEGYRWFNVTTVSDSKTGWVAGNLCSLVTANGCGTGSAPQRFAVNDVVRTLDKLNVRKNPGTTGSPANPATMQATDLIATSTRAMPETAISFARRQGARRLDEVIAYIKEVYKRAPELGFDASIIIAQSAHETGNWGPESDWWADRLNPAGLGITGDPVQDAASQTFASGTAAALGQLAHMHAYVYGNSQPLPSWLVGKDNRYQAVFDANYDGTVSSIADLTGKWATDSAYHTKIAAKGNAIFDGVLGDPAPTSGNAILKVFEAGVKLTLKEGPVTANGYNWFRINQDGVNGWIADEFLELIERNGSTGGSGAEGRYRTGDLVRVADGPLNLRSSASTTASIVSSFDTGNTICISGGPTFAGGYEWYPVPNGYIAGDFTNIEARGGCTSGGQARRFAVGDRIRVADGPLNVRQSASTSASIVGTAAEADQLCVTGGPTFANGYEWYQISSGWIAGDFCELVAAGGCTSTPADGRFSIGDRIYVADGPLNLRDAPSTSAGVLALLSTGKEMCIEAGPRYGGGEEWYRVTAGITGWVAAQYCGMAQSEGCITGVSNGRFSPGDHVEIFDGPLVVRDAPSVEATNLGELSQWSDFCLLEGPEYADGHEWYRMNAYGYAGWVAGTYLGYLSACGFSASSLSTPTALVALEGVSKGSILAARDGLVPLRSTASTSGTVIVNLYYDKFGVVVGGPTRADGHTWYQVDTHAGLGWVPADLMEPKFTPYNYLLNSTADVDLTGITPINAQSVVTQVTVDGNKVVRTVNDGTATGQGVKYASAQSPSVLTNGRYVGIVDVRGSKPIDDVRVRIIYTDGTSDYSAAAPSVTMSYESWQRIVTPALVPDPNKTINELQLRIRRAVATPMTFFTDNAKIHFLTSMEGPA